MWRTLLLCLIFLISFINVNSEDEDYAYFDTTTRKLEEGEEKLSETIHKALEHFKKPNPDGFPGLAIPDAHPVPDMTHSIAFGTYLVVKDTKLHGLNKLRFSYIKVNVEEMECRTAMVIDEISIHGNFSLNTWFTSNTGSYTTTISGLNATAIATLGIERDGKLRAHNISIINPSYKNIAVNLENDGLLAGMLSGVMSFMSTLFFDSVIPSVLKDTQTNMRQEINIKLDELVGDIEFPNTISPIDMVLVDVRNKLRHMKLDPYKIDDYNTSTSIFKIATTNTWIGGISTLHRVGNISFNLENNTIVADFSIGTQELIGSTDWKISAIGDFLSRGGRVSFSVENIKGRIILAVPLDTRKMMQLEDLELELGNIRLGCDGAGTLDYILEFAANVLPNLLRYQIITAIRIPLIWKLQQELDHINVEEMIIDKLPLIDEIQKEGFKLSALRDLNVTDEYDEDDFFNF